MKKKATKPRIYIELIAEWGNADVESTIKVSRHRWEQIHNGAEYFTSAWAWYEGKMYSANWHFSEGEVSVFIRGDLSAMLSVTELFTNIITVTAPPPTSQGFRPSLTQPH
jgi:hypothetical protein